MIIFDGSQSDMDTININSSSEEATSVSSATPELADEEGYGYEHKESTPLQSTTSIDEQMKHHWEESRCYLNMEEDDKASVSLLDDEEEFDDDDDTLRYDYNFNWKPEGCGTQTAETCIFLVTPVLQFMYYFMC